jgi:hypothetical protein
LHIEPVSYGQFNSLLQIRVGTFPVEGFAELDGGKEHIDFLESISLRCKPWKEETLASLDHGLAKAQQMEELYSEIQPKIRDESLARAVESALRMTRLLIQVNNLYVKTAFAYFEYRGEPVPAKEKVLRCWPPDQNVRWITRFRSARKRDSVGIGTEPDRRQLLIHGLLMLCVRFEKPQDLSVKDLCVSHAVECAGSGAAAWQSSMGEVSHQRGLVRWNAGRIGGNRASIADVKVAG